MIIDASIIENGITPEILQKLIYENEKKRPRFKRNFDYYVGSHAIKDRVKYEGAANTKIVCNHAKYITDMIQSYLAGNPVTYSSSEDYDIEAVKDAYFEQDISGLDSEIVKHMSIFGRAYELIYMDESSSLKSVILDPCDTFVVYDNTAQRNKLFAVYYYRRYDLDGICKGIRCCVYDDKAIYIYLGNSDSFYNMQLDSTEYHSFGAVPVIEYRNNEEKQGDFEQIISLIDAYNLLQSDRINDKEQFVEAFLFLTNIELDSEQAQKLKKERILMGYEGAAAQYLSKVMTESDIKVLRDDIKEDIHRFSMVPDLSDESFGNNLSGVAIKYKLMGFEQHVKNKERYFAKGLKERFGMYEAVLSIKGSMREVPVSKVDIVFTRNLPVNELETAQMINNLSGIVCNETLLEQVPFVSDAKEEQALLEKEKQKSYSDRVKAVEGIAKGGGYDGRFSNY